MRQQTEETVESLIRSYRAYVFEGLEDEEEYQTDIMLLLLVRDGLEERWPEMGEAEQAEVKAIDDRLVECWQRVAEMLPSANAKSRRYWWWHLDEGPQVREEAEKRKVA